MSGGEMSVSATGAERLWERDGRAGTAERLAERRLAAASSAARDVIPETQPGGFTVLEEDVLLGLNNAIAHLDTALQLLSRRDGGAAGEVAGAQAAWDPIQVRLHGQILERLAGAGRHPRDLRRVAMLLHVVACVDRIDGETAAIALHAHDLAPRLARKPRIRRAMELMAVLTRYQLGAARDLFASGDAGVAADIAARAHEVEAAGRRLRIRAAGVEDRNRPDRPETLAVVAGHLDRIADEAMEIAEQVAFTTSGWFVEFADLPRSASDPGELSACSG